MDTMIKDKAIAILFAGLLLLLSAAGMVIPEKGFSQSENRFLQTRPEFTWKGLADGTFGTKYETWLSDQFPWRNGWIGMKTMAERAQGKQDINGVYFGRDGYLIEKFDREDIEGEQLQKNLTGLAHFMDAMDGIVGREHVKVMLVPSASQILDHKLPFLAAPYDQSQVVELLRQLISEKDLDDRIVPVGDKLSEHKTEDIYYRTDHHWTALGAYYAYEAWALAAGLEPWRKEDFKIEDVSGDFLGTIHSKVNAGRIPDSINLYLPVAEQKYQVYYDMESQAYDSLYNMEALAGKDKYAVYLDGNHGLTEIRNDSLDGDGKERKLMIVKDSFAHSFAPFAVNHFGVTYMVDLRYFNMDISQFAKRQGITDVLVLYQIPGFSQEKTISKMGHN